MKIEGVIFDWAGTTVDYGCFAPVRAFAEIFREYGIEVTMEETRKPMGMLKWDHIKTMLSMDRINKEWMQVHGRPWTDEDVDQMHDKFAEKLMGILHEYAEIKPFVKETAEELRRRNIKIGSTTGYTDAMMEIVVSKASENGYAPDFWISPNSVGNMGRPYPYMIFENMRQLRLSDVHRVIKVGDTISDVKEGICAGVISVGVLEGSSEMGFSEAEYASLTEMERQTAKEKAAEKFKEAGADYVIEHMGELIDLIDRLES
ncbi:MAG: phosphonoacetaldehyde hydrolase [Clostridium sp.]|nr:phosphonoacetaldehyde hydrolase [Clostridium sp.]